MFFLHRGAKRLAMMTRPPPKGEENARSLFSFLSSGQDNCKRKIRPEPVRTSPSTAVSLFLFLFFFFFPWATAWPTFSANSQGEIPLGFFDRGPSLLFSPQKMRWCPADKKKKN